MKELNRSSTGSAHGPAFHIHPLQLLGIIFLCTGLLFAVIGAAFMAISHDLLPQVFTAARGSDTPDELALPIVGVVFCAIGSLFALIGGTVLLILRRQRLLREELERYGLRVTGAVTDIRIDRTYQVNGRSPLRIDVTVTHPTTGETVIVRSGPVWETPLSTGDAVQVLFDPMDEKKRFVVLEK